MCQILRFKLISKYIQACSELKNEKTGLETAELQVTDGTELKIKVIIYYKLFSLVAQHSTDSQLSRPLKEQFLIKSTW